MAKHLGFTGTRHALSPARVMLLQIMMEEFKKQGYEILHHGDCVGADAEAHKAGILWGYEIEIYPPEDNKLRAFCSLPNGRGKIHDPKPYLIRNRRIVEACDLLLAVPQTRPEVLRSGTWSTVRYARLLGKEIEFIWP